MQFVRKLSGFTAPSKANEAAFDRAVDDVAAVARRLIDELVTNAEPQQREIEAAKAKAALGGAVRPRRLSRRVALDRRQIVGLVRPRPGRACARTGTSRRRSPR